MHPALAASGQVLIEDVAVPRSRLPEMFRAIEEIGARYGIEIPTVAHAGDGNLHPNFVFVGDEVPAHVWAAADDMFRTAVALGGTLTGEHGVGVLKRRWLADELGDDSFELQRGIKALFDPTGILNPGVMFEPTAAVRPRRPRLGVTAGAARPPGDGAARYAARVTTAQPPANPSPAPPLWNAPPRARSGGAVFAIVGIVVAGFVGLLVVAYLATGLGVSTLVIGSVLALVPLVVVLLAVRWIDRWEPEPRWALWFAFLWGAAVSVAIALIIDLGVQLARRLRRARRRHR